MRQSNPIRAAQAVQLAIRRDAGGNTDLCLCLLFVYL
jgi:hypothetical protein